MQSELKYSMDSFNNRCEQAEKGSFELKHRLTEIIQSEKKKIKIKKGIIKAYGNYGDH